MESFTESMSRFREEVEAFLASHGMTPTSFGVAAIKDPNFVFDLREGASPKPARIDKVRRWMEEHA